MFPSLSHMPPLLVEASNSLVRSTLTLNRLAISDLQHLPRCSLGFGTKPEGKNNFSPLGFEPITEPMVNRANEKGTS